MERNREWTSFFCSQHQYSTCSLASTFEIRSSDDFIRELIVENERLLSAQIMIFYHSIFKTLTNSFLNITTFLFFFFFSCLVVRNVPYEVNFRIFQASSQQAKKTFHDLHRRRVWSRLSLCGVWDDLRDYPQFPLLWPYLAKSFFWMHAANMKVRPWMPMCGCVWLCMGM